MSKNARLFYLEHINPSIFSSQFSTASFTRCQSLSTCFIVYFATHTHASTHIVNQTQFASDKKQKKKHSKSERGRESVTGLQFGRTQSNRIGSDRAYDFIEFCRCWQTLQLQSHIDDASNRKYRVAASERGVCVCM